MGPFHHFVGSAGKAVVFLGTAMLAATTLANAVTKAGTARRVVWAIGTLACFYVLARFGGLALP
ncbi:MAG: hypothetical protein KGL43_24800 [Burkholderiales bacterium]|nr:hypothetical protein [Burkholderiales bacterium]MDE2395453.1 hypothetical protein [Burkholderiales bacterium]MDE2456821.1 hypothetical protein [Burkholderiales bacterium]